jgi:hypothetical protein
VEIRRIICSTNAIEGILEVGVGLCMAGPNVSRGGKYELSHQRLPGLWSA